MGSFYERLVHFTFQAGTCCLGIGLIGLGASCMTSPVFAAQTYGLPTSDPLALKWVKVAGLRDLSLGLATLALFVFHPSSLRVFAPSAMLVAMGDAVMTMDGPLPAPYQHVFGSCGILVLSIASWLDRQLDADGSSGYQKF
eukprot:s980_g7.t1